MTGTWHQTGQCRCGHRHEAAGDHPERQGHAEQLIAVLGKDGHATSITVLNEPPDSLDQMLAGDLQFLGKSTVFTCHVASPPTLRCHLTLGQRHYEAVTAGPGPEVTLLP